MHAQKRATFIISSLAGGGAEGVCVNIANGLAEQGWNINLVVLNLNNADYKSRVSSKVSLDVLGVNHIRHAFLPLKKYLNINKPSRILVFNYELAVVMVLLRIILGFKFKLLARNINTISAEQEQAELDGFWRRYIVSPLINSFYFKVDHVINQCKSMESDLLAFYPRLTGKTSVIYNPVAKHIEDYATENDLSQIEKEDYFLCVGRLEKQKAFHYAIVVFSEIVKKHPKMRLKIIGQGALEGSLKQLTIDLSVADKVDFEGFQSNITPYYLHAQATLLTSLYEGFPNVLIESITLGTPVVAFDCSSGPNEIIEDGVNGYLVGYQNVKDFIYKADMALDKNFNICAVRETARRYQVEKILSKYEDLLLSY